MDTRMVFDLTVSINKKILLLLLFHLYYDKNKPFTIFAKTSTSDRRRMLVLKVVSWSILTNRPQTGS